MSTYCLDTRSTFIHSYIADWESMASILRIIHGIMYVLLRRLWLRRVIWNWRSRSSVNRRRPSSGCWQDAKWRRPSRSRCQNPAMCTRCRSRGSRSHTLESTSVSPQTRSGLSNTSHPSLSKVRTPWVADDVILAGNNVTGGQCCRGYRYNSWWRGAVMLYHCQRKWPDRQFSPKLMFWWCALGDPAMSNSFNSVSLVIKLLGFD